MKQEKNEELNNKNLDNVSGGKDLYAGNEMYVNNGICFFAEEASGGNARYDGQCYLSPDNRTCQNTRSISID